MNRLTIDERSLLQSLACRDKVQALSVLEEMEMLLPVRSELFRNVLTLTYKLRNEHIDYAHEIKTAVGELDDEESI